MTRRGEREEGRQRESVCVNLCVGAHMPIFSNMAVSGVDHLAPSARVWVWAGRARMLAAAALLALPPLAHVPQYGCKDGCCHAAHEHSTSQVAYLKNSGGIELDLADLDTDRDGEGEVVDFDFVFKEPYDTSTFSLYVGCGGCASRRPKHWDPTLTLPIDLPEHYQEAKFESFTQHAYYELLPKGQARDEYVLSDRDLAPLRTLRRGNPRNHRWADLRLYIRVELARVQARKHGSAARAHAKRDVADAAVGEGIGSIAPIENSTARTGANVVGLKSETERGG